MWEQLSNVGGGVLTGDLSWDPTWGLPALTPLPTFGESNFFLEAEGSGVPD